MALIKGIPYYSMIESAVFFVAQFSFGVLNKSNNLLI